MSNIDWRRTASNLIVCLILTSIGTFIVIMTFLDRPTSEGRMHIGHIEAIGDYIRDIDSDGVTTVYEWRYICDMLPMWFGQLQEADAYLLSEDGSAEALRAYNRGLTHTKTLIRRFDTSCADEF